MALLALLKSPHLHLSKSEKKVAEIVLDDPQSIIHLPIARVAQQANVSEPTVNRFCHRLKCKGYPDFKVKLAQELTNNQPGIAQDVEPTDDIATLINKVFESTHASLHSTRAATDPNAIEKAVDALAQAKSIFFFGVGASGPVAIDAQHKFFRINTPVIAHIDILNQRMTSSSLSQQDVAVFISYTGRTIAIVDNARIAAHSGATVIGMTATGSPLAAECNIVLPVETPENTDIYTPMTSRINHLVLIDVLATAVALKRGPQFSSHLQKIKNSLQATRYPTEQTSESDRGQVISKK